MIGVVVTCYLNGIPTPRTVELRFHRVPCMGDEVTVDGEDYRVTLVRWTPDPALELSWVAE